MSRKNRNASVVASPVVENVVVERQMSTTPATPATIVTGNKRIVDTLTPVQLVSSLDTLEEQLSQAKATGDQRACKRIRRAMRLRGFYRSRESRDVFNTRITQAK
jgi:hypothetical protein